MDLSNYLGKKVKTEISNSFRYQGEVISVDENSITLIDKFGNKVTLANSSIIFITEANENS